MVVEASVMCGPLVMIHSAGKDGVTWMRHERSYAALNLLHRPQLHAKRQEYMQETGSWHVDLGLG